ncbi:MAG: hypothetical protein ACREIC_01165, partial [Limisphaerales bacterium]
KDVAAYGHADSPPKMLGDRDLNAVLSPLPRNKRGKNPRDAAAPAASEAPSASASSATAEAPAGVPGEQDNGSA